MKIAEFYGILEKRIYPQKERIDKMSANKKISVKKLTMSAVMIGLSVALSMVKIFEMPLGGSVTLLSMLPICMLSIMFGCKWGLFCSSLYALVQLLLDIGKVVGWGLTPAALVGCFVFDYLAAFAVLGLAGLFRKHGVPGYIGGISLVCFLRLVSHVISGVIFFGSWAPEGWNPFIYSVSYNGLYMLPEMAFTIIGSIVLLKEPHSAKLFKVELPAKTAVGKI